MLRSRGSGGAAGLGGASWGAQERIVTTIRRVFIAGNYSRRESGFASPLAESVVDVVPLPVEAEDAARLAVDQDVDEVALDGDAVVDVVPAGDEDRPAADLLVAGIG